MRGKILDKSGVVLAEDLPSYNVGITLEDVEDLDKELITLSSIISVSPDQMKERLDKADLPSYELVVVKNNITDAERVKIEENADALRGVSVTTSYRRYYPYKEIGAAFLGYVGPVAEEDLQNDDFYSINDVIGKQGLELQYEKYLRGTKGRKEVLIDSFGRVKEVLYEEPPIPGANILLNVDIKVQTNLEKIVGDKSSVAIAMDPKTGGIIALVSRPSFDPNLFVQGISAKDYERLSQLSAFINRATQSRFPTGSTFKVLTLISALESDVITPNTTIDCGAYLTIGGRNFKDWIYPSAFGTQTPSVALANSSDVFLQAWTDDNSSTIKKYGDILR